MQSLLWPNLRCHSTSLLQNSTEHKEGTSTSPDLRGGNTDLPPLPLNERHVKHLQSNFKTSADERVSFCGWESSHRSTTSSKQWAILDFTQMNYSRLYRMNSSPRRISKVWATTHEHLHNATHCQRQLWGHPISTFIFTMTCLILSSPDTSVSPTEVARKLLMKAKNLKNMPWQN